jgi:hypothetical protein
MNAHARRKMRFWQAITWFLLTLEKWGWKKPRQAVHTPLIVLKLDSIPGSSRRRGSGKGQEVPMFGIWFHLKVKFWLLAVRFSCHLKRSIEKRAAQSVGLIGGGAMLVDRQGEILSSYLKTLEESTVFGPN